MLRVIAMAALAVIAVVPETFAQGREALGNGRLVNNDLYGDGGDRCQTVRTAVRKSATVVAG